MSYYTTPYESSSRATNEKVGIYNADNSYPAEPSRRDGVERRRRPATPAGRPASVQPRYVAYRSSEQPLSPRAQPFAVPPSWVDEYDDNPVNDTQPDYYQPTPDRRGADYSPVSEPQSDRPPAAQTFDAFLATPAPKSSNIWSRLFCGSRSDRGLVAGDDGQESRSARPWQPSASVRRRARHAGDEDEPYIARSGYDSSTGHTYYVPREHGRQ